MVWQELGMLTPQIRFFTIILYFIIICIETYALHYYLPNNIVTTNTNIKIGIYMNIQVKILLKCIEQEGKCCKLFL